LKVRRLMVEVPPLRVHTKGLLTFSEPGRFELDVKVPAFSFKALPKGLLASKALPTAGTFQTDFVATGLLDNWRAAKLSGQAEGKQLTLKLEGMRAPIEDFNLRVSFEDDRIRIDRGSLRIADSEINATGDVRGWRGVPRIQAVVESPSLDLALLIPEGERSPVRGAMEAISGNAKLAATASVKHARYRGVPFDEIQAKLDGAISGNGNDPRGTAPTVNGDVRVAVEKGYFQRLSATAKVVRLLDLPRLLAGKAEVSEKGMPFDCMSGRVVVKNGIAVIEDY